MSAVFPNTKTKGVSWLVLRLLGGVSVSSVKGCHNNAARVSESVHGQS